MKRLFCIVGETNSGKDTFVNKIIEKYPKKFKAICSYTTRPKREGETEGVEHYFVSDEEFQNIRNSNRVLAYTKFCTEENPDGYEYMATEDELNRSNVYIINPDGIHYLRENFPNIKLSIIYIYASLETRRNRAKNNRSDYEKEFNIRVENETKQFLEFASNKEYDIVIHNNDCLFDTAFEQFEKFMLDEYKKIF